MPKSTKTLLKTPNIKIQPILIHAGEYYHFGIEKQLLDRNIKIDNLIVIDISTDGLPLFKNSSCLKLWPILGSLVNDKNSAPFLIGAYVGRKDPKSSDDFFKQFCTEIKVLNLSTFDYFVVMHQHEHLWMFKMCSSW